MLKNQYNNRFNLQAFSLLELSVIIMVAGLIMAGYVSWMVPAMTSHGTKYKETQLKINKIHEAIENFVLTYGRLPCPANSQTGFGKIDSSTGISFGSEDLNSSGGCNNNVGALPIINLNLYNDYQLDAWGKKFSYVTSPNLCGVAGCSPMSFSSGSANLVIQDLGGSTTYLSTAAYVVISHGPDGRGAYAQSGTQISSLNTDEVENYNGDNIFRSGTLSSTFQHLLTYRSQNDLNTAIYEPGRVLVSAENCLSNSTYLALMSKSIASNIRINYTATQIVTNARDEFSVMGGNVVKTTNYGDEAVLELMWILQETCYALYPTVMNVTRACPQDLTYNADNNACVYNNGFWDPAA